MRYWIAFRADGTVIPYTMAPRANPGDRVIPVMADHAGEAIELAEAIVAATLPPRDPEPA